MIRLTDPSSGNCYWGFCWSPDGKKIAFSRNGGDGKCNGIYVMNPDGSNTTQLTQSEEFDGNPDWQPVYT